MWPSPGPAVHSALMDIRRLRHVEKGRPALSVGPEEVAGGGHDRHQGGGAGAAGRDRPGGDSALDNRGLTGESLPDVAAGDEVISGCVNLSGLLHVKGEQALRQSTVARILDLVENSSEKKAQSGALHHQIRPVLYPAVVLPPWALAVIPSLLDGQWGTWVPRALNFLVCPAPVPW